MKYSIIVFSILLSGCEIPDVLENFTVVSWNVQNLFDGEDNGTEYPEFDPGGAQWNHRLYQRRLDRVGEVILDLSSRAPDLLILQEIENADILKDLLRGPLKGRGYQYSFAVPHFSIIRCGILSRYPVRNVRAYDCGVWEGRPLRPAVVFTVVFPFSTIDVIAVHWKSPRDGRELTEIARRQEAALVKKLIVKKIDIDPSAAILLVGDLNTPGDGFPIPAALGPPETSGSILLRTSNPAETSSSPLILFDPEPSEGPPGTYFFRGEWGRPDRLLLSPGLMDRSGWMFDYCHIADLEYLLDSRGHPRRWSTDSEEGYSDHLPLIAGFVLP